MGKNDVTNPHDAYFEETQAPWSVSFQKTFFKIHIFDGFSVLMLIVVTFEDGVPSLRAVFLF